MIKDVKFNGYSAQPSDYECPDGDLAMSLNLINEDGQIKTIGQPDRVLTLCEGERVLFIHSVPNQKNYILAKAVTGSSVNLLWMMKASTITDTKSAQFIATVGNVLDISAIGNTIVLALEDRIVYLFWKDGYYVQLKNRPPFISIDFGMHWIGQLSNSGEFVVPARCSPSWPANHPRPEKNALDEITQMAYGLLNPAIADKINSKSFFYQPFFVRYAYRLYDETHCWHSSPILMLPNLLPPLINYKANGEPSADGSQAATFRLEVPYFELVYRILSDVADELANWIDIVKGIDIFVSPPIYTYDQSKNLDEYSPVTTQKYILDSISRSDINDDDYDVEEPPTRPGTGGMVSPTYESEIFVGHFAYSVEGPYVDYTATKNNDYYLNILFNDKFYRNIQSSHEFYKFSEIDIKDITAMTRMERVKTDVDLSYLVARPTLDDEYQSHFNLRALSLYAFNSRLNLAGVKIAPAEPFPIRSIMQFGNPDGGCYAKSVQIKVWSRINGVKCYAVHTGTENNEADLWYYPEKNFPRYIYYPDASAYKMEISTSEKKYTIGLESHDFLNGAFYFCGKKGMRIDFVPTNAEAETDMCATYVNTGAKIYTSEINNPFIFPAVGVNNVGTGDLFAVCSAAKALSQGQFGQFPLYAFTTEGVWALETTADGTFSAVQPISRDVCLSRAGITQIDSAVLFPTDRGIMLISGSQIQCISDILNTDNPFDVFILPGLNSLHSMLGYDVLTCLQVAPFSEFLNTCRMIYDYAHQHIIVFSSEHTYAYVYSLKSQRWGLMFSNLLHNVNSYPEALAVDCNNNLVDFSKRVDGNVKGLLVTRPLKLDAPDILKTVDTVIQRGNFAKGHVQSVIYGSRDLQNWHLVCSSKDHYLRGFRGTPYKYFRIVSLCDLAPGESVYGASLQFTPRLTDRLR